MFLVQANSRKGLDTFVTKWLRAHDGFEVIEKYVTEHSFPILLGANADTGKKKLVLEPIGLTHSTE